MRDEKNSTPNPEKLAILTEIRHAIGDAAVVGMVNEAVDEAQGTSGLRGTFTEVNGFRFSVDGSLGVVALGRSRPAHVYSMQISELLTVILDAPAV